MESSVDLRPAIQSNGLYTWAGKNHKRYRGSVQAIDQYGKIRWKKDLGPTRPSGILSTAANLLFLGTGGGTLFILDTKKGTALKTIRNLSQFHAAPISFTAENRQYIVLAGKGHLYALSLKE